MACLLCRQNAKPEHVGERFELIFGSTLMGRGVLSDIRVPEPGLPRKIAELRRLQDGRHAIIPLNGASVGRNQQPLKGWEALADGDLIEVGRTVFEYRVEGKGPVEAGAAATEESAEQDKPEKKEAGRPVSLVEATVRLVFGTLASRVLGLVREVVMAAYFGAGAAMDVFVVAFTIPNLFRRVFGEVALESAFLPAFKTFLSRGEKKEAWRLASTVCNILTLLLALTVIGLYVLAPIIVKIAAPGFSEELFAQTVSLTRFMLPFTFFIGIAGFLGSLLLARGRYTAYSLAPSMFNIGSILGVLLFYERLGIYSLAVGTVLAGAGQMLAQVHGFFDGKDGEASYRPIIDWKHPGAKKALSLTGPILVTSAIDKVSEVTKRLIASYLATGSIAALSYSFRLIHLPFSVIGLALSRGVLPFLAEQSALNNMKEFKAHLVRGLNLCAFLMLPTSVATAVLAVPTVETVLAHGAWQKTNPEATWMTAIALIFFAVGLWPMSTVSILTRAFHAVLDTRSPLRVGIYGFVANIVLSVSLAFTPLGHGGLALAVSADYVIQVGLMVRELRRRFAASGEEFGFSSLLKPVLPMTIASVAMGLVLELCAAAWWPGADARVIHRCVALAALAGVGTAVYGAAVLALRVPEAMAIQQRISRRLGRSGRRG
jgi:putative peptidoglycan lipid II flippase